MRCAPAVLSALLMVACEDHAPSVPPPPQPGTTSYRDDRAGFQATFPSDWYRAGRPLTRTLLDPREILSVGTVRPVVNRPTRCSQYPISTLARVGPDDVFLSVQERRAPPGSGFPQRPRRVRLGPADGGDAEACLGRPVPFGFHWIDFQDGDRGFYVMAAVGRDASARRRRQLVAAIESLRFDRRARKRYPPRASNDTQRGMSFTHPGDWRVYPFQLTEVVALRHQVALGTFPLQQDQPDAHCSPSTAQKARPPSGGLLFVFEYEDLNARQRARFPRRPRRFRTRSRDPQPYECFDRSHLVRWTERGRAFQAHLQGPPRRIRQALGILDSMRVMPRGRE